MLISCQKGTVYYNKKISNRHLYGKIKPNVNILNAVNVRACLLLLRQKREAFNLRWGGGETAQSVEFQTSAETFGIFYSGCGVQKMQRERVLVA